MSRFLAIGRTVPAQATGTALMTRRLLEHFKSEELIFLGRTPDRKRKLPAEYRTYPVIEIPAFPQGGTGESYWMLAAVIPGVLLGWNAIRRYHPKVILAIYPDEGALLTGLVLSRLSKLPFAAYFCDVYAEEVRVGWRGRLARWLQPRVFRASDQILALTGGIVEMYQEKYGVRAELIPHCINFPIPDFTPLPPPGKPFVIGYSGNVNASRLDALKQLVAVIRNSDDYELRYFSPNPQAYFESHGIWADNTRLSFVKDQGELLQQLMACDLLYLPVAFAAAENSYEELKTSFGTKTFEYFLSKKPILLHSPADYYITEFFRRNACGYVVDQPSTEIIAAALHQLRFDLSLRNRLVENALSAAHQFEGPKVAHRLRLVLERTASIRQDEIA